ncbi:MAG TPA: hypothetical protein VHA09_03725 [Nitrososphaera sp.]|nr:hypothetical protein [Nitrososphaera sp.]
MTINTLNIKPRMVAAKTFIARMNEGHFQWLTEAQMLKACEEFFTHNGYSGLDYGVTFAGHQNFTSPIIGSSELETIATIFHSRLDRYDMGFFGTAESALYDVIDNHDKATLMLATDSLSYGPIIKNEDIGVAIENLMDEGLYLLFVNGRLAHALFDDFKKLTAPVLVQD